jgi:hypothetical protein
MPDVGKDCDDTCKCGDGMTCVSGKCCLDVCSESGAPMWSNKIRLGNGSSRFTPDATPKECCLSCYKDPVCLQWRFIVGCEQATSPGTCVADTLVTVVPSGSRCSQDPVDQCLPPVSTMSMARKISAQPSDATVASWNDI